MDVMNMNRFKSSKYLLFAFACAFFIGCFLYSIKLISVYILLPAFVLSCLLAFSNRHSKSLVIIAILIIAVIFGALEYHIAAARQSSILQFKGKTVTIAGIAAEDPIPTEYGYKLLLKNVNYIENNKIYKCIEKVQVYIGKDDKLQFGDHVKLLAEIDSVAKLRNFGDFDYEKYYKSKGIYVKAYAIEITKLASNKGGFFASLLHYCNQKVKNTVFSALPQTEAALLYGILTGSKSDIDQEVMQVFSQTGLAHILSVSGLHIGFLVLLLSYLLNPLKLNKQIHSLIVFLIVLFYVLIIGAPVPAVRALFMLAVMLLGKAVGKEYDLNASASFAALLLLVYNPLLIHDPSFIISFSCIYSICFLHKPINKAMSFLPTWIRSSLTLSIAVWIGITPILISYFNYISLINIILNVIAVPIAFLITLAGFAAVVIGLLLPTVAIFVFAASYYLIRLLYFISEKSLLLPFAGINIPSLGWYLYLIYYIGMLTLVEDFWKYKSTEFKRNYIAAGVVAICIVIIINIIPGTALKVYYIDVGQGDCSVIKTPNRKVIIVDGGGSADWQKSSYDIGKKITVPALLHIGIWQVDTVIISHIHEDHMGGVLSILENYKVRQVVLPASDRYGEGEFTSENFEKLKAICKSKKIPITYMQSNSLINAGSNVKFEVLAPSKPYIRNTDSDVNNNSLVFKLIYKDFDGLYVGDIQQEAEERLLKKNIQCDVLKVAHHGSPYSSIEEFVEKADPEISIISVGKNNYGHPANEVIDRLKAKESQVFRTDLSGAVLLTTDGKSIKIRTVR
jgi:competence protein ComEC